MIYENIELGYLYQLFSNFKESEIDVIRNVLTHTRAGRIISFKCYANIEFDESDTKHKFPKITELEKFTRKNTNCVVFAVTDDFCKNTYTHIFVYHNVTASLTTYGLIKYNKNTGNLSQTIQIDDDPGELILQLNKTMMFMQNPDPFRELRTKTR